MAYATGDGLNPPICGHGHTAPIVVRDVNDVHMAKGSSLSENTKMKEGARGIEKSNWGIEKFDGKIKEWNL